MKYVILNFVFDDGEEYVQHWPLDGLLTPANCEEYVKNNNGMGLVAIEIVGTC